jgi:uncharacterized caspase-like protein
MARGISINIGLNRVHPAHYGSTMPMRGCEYDARDMERIAQDAGFQDTVLLLSQQATCAAVRQAINNAAQQLQLGDIMLLTYSGHGGKVPDSNMDENDGRDETWCLFDREMLDDELFELLAQFEAGVRILVISDSCHSGTVVQFKRGLALLSQRKDLKLISYEFEYSEESIKAISNEVADEIFKRHRKEYEQVQQSYPYGNRVAVNASVLLISACQDEELAMDGARNGLFTAALRDIWNNGRFRGNYIEFHEEIYLRTSGFGQQPNYYKVGVPSARFEMQKPFII